MYFCMPHFCPIIPTATAADRSFLRRAGKAIRPEVGKFPLDYYAVDHPRRFRRLAK